MPPLNPAYTPKPTLRKSTRTYKKPTWIQSYHTYNATSNIHSSNSEATRISNLEFITTQVDFSYFLSNLSSHNVPLFFKHVVIDLDWVTAMNLELEALEKNQT